MSGFVVKDETICLIVDFLYSLQFAREGMLCHVTKFRNMDASELPALALSLEQMNLDACAGRYPSDEKRIADVQYKQVWSVVSGYWQVLKSLDCYLYQCLEGDIPNRSLFQHLECIRDSLAKAIVCSDPRYNAASWG